jgi:hypothetical protein
LETPRPRRQDLANSTCSMLLKLSPLSPNLKLESGGWTSWSSWKLQRYLKRTSNRSWRQFLNLLKNRQFHYPKSLRSGFYRPPRKSLLIADRVS